MDNNTPQLTDQEKKYLEEYNEENPFLKSLSDFYKERTLLTEKQILALRKELNKDKKKLNRCQTTSLNLHQECYFQDDSYKEDKKIKVTAIREKAICVADDENNLYAWMPSSAIDLEKSIDNNTGDETPIIKLKGWFTRDDDFWKQSKPFEPKKKEEHIIEDDVVITPDAPTVEHDGIKYNPENPKETLEFNEEQDHITRKNYDYEDELYPSNIETDEDDELPF